MPEGLALASLPGACGFGVAVAVYSPGLLAADWAFIPYADSIPATLSLGSTRPCLSPSSTPLPNCSTTSPSLLNPIAGPLPSGAGASASALASLVLSSFCSAPRSATALAKSAHRDSSIRIGAE